MNSRKKRKYPQQKRVFQFAARLLDLTMPVLRYQRVSHEMVFQRCDFTETIALKKKKVFEKRRESLAKAFRYARVMDNRYSGSIFVKFLEIYDIFCSQMNMAHTFMLNAFQDNRFDDAVKYIYYAYRAVCDNDRYLLHLINELTADSLLLDIECRANDIYQIKQSFVCLGITLRRYQKLDYGSVPCSDFLQSNSWMGFAFDLDRAQYHLERAGKIINKPLADEIQIMIHILRGYMPMPCIWSEYVEEGGTDIAVHLVNEGFRHCEERRHELENLTGKLSLELKANKENLRSKKKALKENLVNKQDASISDKTPTTLIKFMQEHCEKQSIGLLKCRRKSLNDAQNRNVISLPKHIEPWKSGQPKRYRLGELKECWPKLRETLSNLPELRR